MKSYTIQISFSVVYHIDKVLTTVFYYFFDLINFRLQIKTRSSSASQQRKTVQRTDSFAECHLYYLQRLRFAESELRQRTRRYLCRSLPRDNIPFFCGSASPSRIDTVLRPCGVFGFTGSSSLISSRFPDSQLKRLLLLLAL